MRAVAPTTALLFIGLVATATAVTAAVNAATSCPMVPTSNGTQVNLTAMTENHIVKATVGGSSDFFTFSFCSGKPMVPPVNLCSQIWGGMYALQFSEAHTTCIHRYEQETVQWYWNGTALKAGFRSFGSSHALLNVSIGCGKHEKLTTVGATTATSPDGYPEVDLQMASSLVC